MLTQEDLEQCAKTVTDRIGAIMDAYRKGLRLVFRCSASGLLYPEDYIKNWGVKYGIGLGPHVCSESLQSDYATAPPEITGQVTSIEQIMHPLYSSMAQMDHDMVPESQAEEMAPVLAHLDGSYRLRAPILRGKQLRNKQSRIQIMSTKFAQLN
jgi:hypothetical protein